MCGIAGIMRFTRQPISPCQIKLMTDSLIHRGPDGEGQWIDDYIGFGHRRLAIIDLSPAGHQPMQTKDGRYTITYNGEIYNFKELRTELESRGHRFYSNTDTEVVLNAYVEWQEKCLSKFNGMFAFAIWDKQYKRLFLARDRYGIKPLYYYKKEDVIVFASEIKAIIKSDLYETALDKEALIEYLTFQNLFTDKTLFQDVKILMPGHYSVVNSNGVYKTSRYWDFKFESDHKITEVEAIEEVRRLFEKGVKRQLISDVPINAYLSGGIDSAAVTMVAKGMLPDMKTFTIGFDLSSASGLEMAFDERKKAEHASYLAKTEHYEMVLKAGDMERCMDQYVRHLEEPRVGQSYPNYYAAKLASKFGKVVLSGCGGDELFGGYPWRYMHEPTTSFNHFIDEYYKKWQRLISNSVISKLLAPIWEEINHISTRDIFESIFDPIKSDILDPEISLNASLYLEAKTFLHGLLVVEDKLSMAHSLETRIPFLDNDLVDFAMKVPPKYKIKPNNIIVDENSLILKNKSHKNGKIVLRKALSTLLDSQITSARKQGFSSPDASWFRGESIDYVEHLFKNTPYFLDDSIVNDILNVHMAGQVNNRLPIFSFLYLTKLHNAYFI